MMTDRAILAYRGLLRRRRFAFLLGALAALVLLAPLLGTNRQGETGAAVLFSLVVLGMASAARRTRVALGVVCLWLVLTWVGPLGENNAAIILSDLCLLAVCVVSAESALRRALQFGHVDSEALCAAVSTYLIIGVAWAAAYEILFLLDPEAFRLGAEDAVAPWNALLYFSFATLTTLGYGDIAPVSALARAWAGAEAVSGTIYLAILIAYLVSNFRAADGTGCANSDGFNER